jgi:hypothetical protein
MLGLNLGIGFPWDYSLKKFKKFECFPRKMPVSIKNYN